MLSYSYCNIFHTVILILSIFSEKGLQIFAGNGVDFFIFLKGTIQEIVLVIEFGKQINNTDAV